MRLGSLLLAASCLAVVSGGHASARQPPAAPIRFINATLVDLESGRTTPAQSLFVRDGRIATLGAGRRSERATTTERRDDVRTVDLQGRFVIPGLADAHAHLSELQGVHVVDDARDPGWSYFSALMLAHGVTAARIPAGNLARLRGLRDAVNTGALSGPRLWITGAKLGREPVVPGAPFPVGSDEDVAGSVRMLAEARADLVKLHAALPSTLWLAGAREARARGLAVEAHVPSNVPLVMAAGAGLTGISHLFGFALETSGDAAALRELQRPNSAASWLERIGVKLRLRESPPPMLEREMASHSAHVATALYARLREHGVWVTPTLVLHAGVEKDGAYAGANEATPWLDDADRYTTLTRNKLRPQSPEQKARFDFYLKLASDMHAAGVGLLAGSDAPVLNPPGFGLHAELGMLVRAGMTPREALRAATASFGRATGDDTVGTLRTGGPATFVVLDANPLVDVANTRRIAMVVAGGRLFDRTELDRLLARALAIASRHREAMQDVARIATADRPAQPIPQTNLKPN